MQISLVRATSGNAAFWEYLPQDNYLNICVAIPYLCFFSKKFLHLSITPKRRKFIAQLRR
jgi:hypothetical protein